MMTASRLLRLALTLDAVATSAIAMLLVTSSTALDPVLAIPARLLFYVGLALIPYGVLVAILATRPTVHRTIVWAVIAGNALWVIDSVLSIALGWIVPNAWGTAFVIGQALAVAMFVELQYIGLRRSAPATATSAGRPLHAQSA
jgi:hypothetical protein